MTFDKEPDYDVGYRKPPRHTRFTKGQSGNPRGRPPGAKNLNETVIVTGRRRPAEPSHHPRPASPWIAKGERKQLNLSRFYAIAQIEYCRNFIFKRNFPIHKLFERRARPMAPDCRQNH